MRSTCLIAATTALLALGTAVSAQTPPAGTSNTMAAPTARAPTGKAQAPRSEASLACSKQADEKGLHGKARKTFRSACMHKS